MAKKATKTTAQATRGRMRKPTIVDFGDTVSTGEAYGSHRSPSSSRRVSDPMTIADYDAQRPAEADPKGWEEIFRVCDRWYQKSGLVRNIVDLMGDFCCAGIQVSSPDPGQQAILRKWFEEADGQHVSERIANMLYRLGNVGIRKQYARVRTNLKKEWQEAAAQIKAQFKIEVKIPDKIADENLIPLKYVTISPKYIRVPRPEVSAFLPEPFYGLRITKDSLQPIQSMMDKDIDEDALINQLGTHAADVQEALKTGKTVKLDNDRFEMLHYKKDDFDKRYAYPLIYAAHSDLVRYAKMMLADSNVVDSAIKNITFVKIGDPKSLLMPTQEHMDKVTDQIKDAGASGSKTFIVTQPFLNLEEATSSLVSFLGKSKFEPIIEAIYATFGIPAALTGTASGAAANNFMSMKVLIKKLEYVRGLLVKFWKAELKRVCVAFGFDKPVFLTFTYQELGDESAIKKLIQDMYDRDVISEETYQYQMGMDHQLETLRTESDRAMRKAGTKSPKAGPFHNANMEIDIKKSTILQGTHTPEEWGVIPKPIDPEGRKSRLEIQSDLLIKAQDNQGELDMDMAEKQSQLDIKRDKEAPPQPAPVIPGQPGTPVKKATKKATKKTTKKAVKKAPGLPGAGRPRNQQDTKPRKEREYKGPRKT